MRKRAVVLCPGRGGYTAKQLGYLGRPLPQPAREQLLTSIARTDRLRGERNRLGLHEMDGSSEFRQELLRSENANSLIFACTALDWLLLDPDKVDVVAVGGNSMGWYSALFASGVFGLDDAFDLVDAMGELMSELATGGQVIYPVVGEDWRSDPPRAEAITAAMSSARDSGGASGASIHFGGFEVVWADDAGIPRLVDGLPAIELGEREYPLRIPASAAFHSPLMQGVSERALVQLQGLPWRAPSVPLIDGRGQQFRPLYAEPSALRDYTLRTQVVCTFDFTSTVRVALREYAPDLLVLLGPGDTLGAAVAQVIIAERWRGIDSRTSFLDRQESDPLLISMARDEQAGLVTM